MGGQEGRGVLGRAVKKVKESRTEGDLRREGEGGQNRGVLVDYQTKERSTCLYGL